MWFILDIYFFCVFLIVWIVFFKVFGNMGIAVNGILISFRCRMFVSIFFRVEIRRFRFLEVSVFRVFVGFY